MQEGDDMARMYRYRREKKSVKKKRKGIEDLHDSDTRIVKGTGGAGKGEGCECKVA